ncbi:DNA-directed RNA polymerase subunit omega [Desulfosoma caldarium]|uniref:DNA-directed RNA polymerase subunit omega n=1 Tax=Desulfosoma caldarium TaxID=610254 RepID=A0A3N1UUT1_9BACT|nr:DNA-directed RNA polymerase subunit omega [Desulfosoma caldarium]ROQ90866.1 DNA-directed RNA polymerase subunit omega [Desulfosoma caldarium]
MARVTVEDCLRQVENRFALVHLAVRRVLQLRKGATPLIDAPKNKEVVVALREIAAGKVTPENILELEAREDHNGELALPHRIASSSEEIQEVMKESAQSGTIEGSMEEAVLKAQGPEGEEVD